MYAGSCVDFVCVNAGSDPKDAQKLRFISEHFQKQSPFDIEKEMDKDVQSALAWMKERSPEQVINEREYIISEIERQGERMWKSGECDVWLDTCTHGAREVVKGVNGPMMCQLARRTRFDDIKATERFRSGVPFFGLMEKCNLGQEVEHNSPPSVDELRVDCIRSNTLLLEQLKENEYSSELLELTRADAAVGRMSMPTPIENVDLGLMRLCPRFPVIQGEREDGRPKVRPVDHFSWSAPPVGAEKREGKKQMRCNSINGRTVLPEKMKYDHIDELTQVAKWIFNDLKVSTSWGMGRFLLLESGCTYVCSGSARHMESRHQSSVQKDADLQRTPVGSGNRF